MILQVRPCLIIKSPLIKYDFNKKLHISSKFGLICFLKLEVYFTIPGRSTTKHRGCQSPLFSRILLRSGRCIPEDSGCQSPLFFTQNDTL